MDKIHLSFEWPDFPDDSFQEEFLFGVWHPFSKLQVDIKEPPMHVKVDTTLGTNWSIVSSKSPFQATGKGLAHVPDQESNNIAIPACVAFRGYTLEPPIHSWSESREIIDYWSKEHSRHNGVFVSIIISHNGDELRFVSDAYGIATLYYREIAGGVIFSTNSRFLTTANDKIDYVSARILMQCGSVYGNGSLTEGVSRVPPGTSLSFRRTGVTNKIWFSYLDLPTGTKPVTLAGLHEVEESFQNAISRCLRLQTTKNLLPLSSGHDSRRILAALHSKSVPFSALTVKVLQKENRDLDAHWASVMSRDLGFEHHVVDLPAPGEYARLDRLRRVLVDSHGTEHTWFLTMNAHIPNQQSLIFDGLGGDVFGNTGFGVEEYHTADDRLKIQLILNDMITDSFDKILNAQLWPNIQRVRQVLNTFLSELPDGRNKPDIAFLLMRCRSGPGMCFQRLIPAGHVTVYPYYDLDYANKTLEFNPLEKRPPNTLQARCLSEFWPKYFAFPGSRMIPEESLPGDPRLLDDINLACFQQIQSEAGYPWKCNLNSYLTKRASTAAIISLLPKALQHRVQWWLNPLLMILARQANNGICWK